MQQFGGLPGFTAYPNPFLTDSGGFQVMSLGDIRTITEHGVTFKNHINGDPLEMTPESSIQAQEIIGADIIMAFDECTPYPCDYRYAQRSMHMTHRWLDRCIKHLENLPYKYGYEQTFMPIVQGSTYKDLRKQSAKYRKLFRSWHTFLRLVHLLKVRQWHFLVVQIGRAHV